MSPRLDTELPQVRVKPVAMLPTLMLLAMIPTMTSSHVSAQFSETMRISLFQKTTSWQQSRMEMTTCLVETSVVRPTLAHRR